MEGETVFLFSDGSAYPRNPGWLHLGAVLFEESEVLVASISEKLTGKAAWGSSNDAEYLALIRGMEKAWELGYRRIICRADSELIVHQINGVYRVRQDNLKRHHRRVVELIEKFGKDNFDIKWHSRDSDWARIADVASRGVTFPDGDEKWLILKTLAQTRKTPGASPTPRTSASKSEVDESTSRATGS